MGDIPSKSHGRQSPNNQRGKSPEEFRRNPLKNQGGEILLLLMTNSLRIMED
jgi:hypothetical protein